MNASWNEIAALAGKAARGAGAPPAQAASFGRAAASHLAQTRPESEIKTALDMLPQGPILSLPTALHSILASRKDGTAEGVIDAALTPKLAQSYVECLPVAATQKRAGDQIILRLDLDAPTPDRSAPRVNLSLDLYYMMQELAARTYVPDSAASRASGAGAGLTDND